MIEAQHIGVDSGQSHEIEAFVVAHPAATAYARAPWLAAMRRFMGVEAWYQVARLDGVIVGVLPVAERPLFRRSCLWPRLLRPMRRESLGYDCYGGPLLAPDLDAADAGRVLDVLVHPFVEAPALLATLFPPAWADLAPIRRRLEGVHGFRGMNGYPIAVKSLEGLTPAKLPATYHKKHRNAVMAAQKRGVKVHRAGGVGDLLEFWDLLDETMAHAGMEPKFPKDFVVEGGLALIAADVGDLWIARLDGVPTAGAFVLRAGRTTCWWLGAASRDEVAQQARPMNAVIHAALSDALERGHEHFELGGLITEGLRSFKTRWGVNEYEQVMLERSPFGLADAGRRARAGARRVLCRLRS